MDEWFRLKCDEQYGMYVSLKKEISALRAQIDSLEQRYDTLIRVMKNSKM